jgi:glycosyltransferase involved in cell wall biosynthesis
MLSQVTHAADTRGDKTAPFLSVIVPVYNDWGKLVRCINSIAGQTHPPSFELVVVDDGSDGKNPKLLDCPNLTLIRQERLGVSHARNRGIAAAKGELLLFVDADCALEPDCLSELERTFRNNPKEIAFQLYVVGENSSIVGRAEWLSLSAIQGVLVDADGRIRWLNTAGFAAVRTLFTSRGLQFEPRAVRAQDTYLLSELIRLGYLPYLATQCVVHHCVDLGIADYLVKSFRAAFPCHKTYSLIESQGGRVHVRQKQRFQIFQAMLKNAKGGKFGLSAFVIAILRYTFGKAGLLLARQIRQTPRVLAPVQSESASQGCQIGTT